MKKLILFGIFFSFISCEEVQIEPNKRIEINGRLLNENAQPVSGVEIIAAGTHNGNLGYNVDKLLGKALTRPDGNFNFISLDSYSHDLIFSVNPLELGNRAELASLYFLDPTGNHDTLYELGEIQLGRNIEFELKINNISGTQDTLRYKFEYQRPVKYFTYFNGNFVQENTNDNQIYLREHRPDEGEVVREIDVLGGTNFKFTYNLGENPVQEIIIPITPENTSYEFEY